LFNYQISVKLLHNVISGSAPSCLLHTWLSPLKFLLLLTVSTTS